MCRVLSLLPLMEKVSLLVAMPQSERGLLFSFSHLRRCFITNSAKQQAAPDVCVFVRHNIHTYIHAYTRILMLASIDIKTYIHART